MKSAFIIFLFIIFSSSFSLAENNEKITIEEIKDILLYSEQANELNFPGESHEKWEEEFKKLTKSGTIKKRIQNRRIAKCLYKKFLTIDKTGIYGDYTTSYLYTDPNEKKCIGKIIRTISGYPEKSKKRRPGDIFYALEAIERLVFDEDKQWKFVRSAGVYVDWEDDQKKKYFYSDKAIEPESPCVELQMDFQPNNYHCSFFSKYTKKKVNKFKKDPSNEKVLGKPLIQHIKNVRMVRSIRKKIGNGNFALLGDMLNAVVVDVKKNNISPDLKKRRALLKKYSLILKDIKKKLDEDKYKSINKDVSNLSKTYKDLNALITTNEILIKIDEAVDNIFDTNKFIQKSVLNSNGNEEEELLALSSIYFMQSLVDSILSTIPEKYYVETKELSRDLFNKDDLDELNTIINTMINTNKEIKSAELTKSMDKINKYINTSDVLKKLDNLGMKNSINREFTQNTVSRIASQEIRDNLSIEILKDAKKLLEEIDKNELSDLTKEASGIAKEVSKEVSKSPKYNSVLDHKFGGQSLKRLIAISRR